MSLTDYPVKDGNGNTIIGRDVPQGSSIPRTAPAEDFAAVVPSDVTAFTEGRCRALYVGVSGNVTCLNADGTAVQFLAVPVGILPVRTSRVNATGTTATNIVALY